MVANDRMKMRGMILCSFYLASLVAVYEGEWEFSAVYIAIFNASIIVPVFL